MILNSSRRQKNEYGESMECWTTLHIPSLRREEGGRIPKLWRVWRVAPSTLIEEGSKKHPPLSQFMILSISWGGFQKRWRVWRVAPSTLIEEGSGRPNHPRNGGGNFFLEPPTTQNHPPHPPLLPLLRFMTLNRSRGLKNGSGG
jgi:hypothetical protein